MLTGETVYGRTIHDHLWTTLQAILVRYGLGATDGIALAFVHGLRMGVPFAMIGAILAEFISSNQGLGGLILYSSASLDTNGLWAALAFLVAAAWLLGMLLSTVEARVLDWQPQRRDRPMRA